MPAEELEEEIKRIGAAIIHCSSSSKDIKVFQRQWRAHFDASPEVIKIFWMMVDVSVIKELENFLWVILFLKM